ncbi:FAD-binding oxidoreductase [Rhizobiaceae bacterium n13]|uniref:D-2-hydroxyglutarate dehydrogenase n=1 Tax=Ferirhizobium litorale TaxID=2927786 RepID=A0AAE3Q9N4_9HYPH|nr:FAD-binding and (Fe-S)-binding domain-containing protein [Fererhizobium litorale]MDI7861871.1 FAD-binding oxidoreductase [Fererhizobium litorale]MDI7921787.1 FAD-binding oxidoreductase [Fererhizobium litorale]
MGLVVRDHLAGKPQLGALLDALRASGYRGDIADDPATRTVFSTDNSIYQVPPAAVLFPREAEDLNRIVRLAASTRFGPIPLSPRGGGTGTNGQSLTSGIVVDTSRYLNQIISFDAEKRLVTVGPGVVLDQINAFLKPHGLFFPPTVSTSSRATLGGMVATDASGKGSRIYGRTSDYIEALEIVLPNGDDFAVGKLSPDALNTICGQDDIVGLIHSEVRRIVTERAALIAEVFPEMNRGLTGYNLRQVLAEDGSFNLARLLAGSEGTLALTKSITLRVIPRPSHRAIVAIRYAFFQRALEDVRRLLAAEPAAIEILDDKVLAVAQQDVIWSGIEKVLGTTPPQPVGGLNFVEFVGDSETVLAQQIERLEAMLAADPGAVMDWTVVRDAATVTQMWELRKKAVGLLGKMPGKRQGIPFVEDTAVPPENLAAYVAEFRALLDGYGLTYGMFGHADVGCLHVRPALDMTNPEDAKLIRPISDAVAQLTRKYGGLLWGEHGRGFRGEYSPFFFGSTLYAELCRIKAAFDPMNIFNPGKLASPGQVGLIDHIDEVPLRGERDRVIAAARAAEYDRAIACNGNGACHSWNVFEPMCPSFKATSDRTQSPKGRAALLREWARLDTEAGTNPGLMSTLHAFEYQVKQSLSTCLSCKACSNQCPVKVDIPTMKARFLDRYHRRIGRSHRDRLVARMEDGLAIARRMPRLANLVAGNPLFRALLAKGFGLIDLPAFSVPRGKRPFYANPADLTALSAGEKARSLILMEDGFTAAFDRGAVEAIDTLLTRLGYRVHRARATRNGKALHVRGMLEAFRPVAEAARAHLARWAAIGLPIIGAESVTALMHEQEYAEGGYQPAAPIQSVDQFLASEIAAGRLRIETRSVSSSFKIFLHCTEKTARPKTAANWTAVFAAFGLEAEIPATGCCGMAGLFGHESEHQEMSKAIFDMSWRPHLDKLEPKAILATGFSCRCQTKRLNGNRPRHPAEALLDHLNENGSMKC